MPTIRFDDPAARLAERLPPELAPLARSAYDLAWSWQPGAAELFRSIDPQAWAKQPDPVRLLLLARAPALERAAKDRRLTDGARELEAVLAARRARAATGLCVSVEHPAAFICAEYALHPSLPLYSGGLGVLAGDYLKEAADRAVPLVAVGLFYRFGYFRQRIDRSGWQHEYAVEALPDQLPMALAMDERGEPVLIRVPLGRADVLARIFCVQIGNVRLFLLDADVDQNPLVMRWITAQLYVPAREMRLLQYALLGIGAVRALGALGIDPSVIHLNEGHAALAALELARPALQRGRSLAEAVAEAKQRLVFTTHTPVAAGNENYAMEEVVPLLERYFRELGLAPRDVLASGRILPHDEKEWFGLTPFALRTSRSANGVSRKHGAVARDMWKDLYPGVALDHVPITHVTNGVHLPTWMAPPMRALLERHLGSAFTRDPSDPGAWKAMDAVPDEELWKVRAELRARLVERVRTRSTAERLARGESIAYAEQAARSFDDRTLTLGFARRLASYKRLHLLIQDGLRALRLLAGERPVQLVIAGKAHPLDDDAKRLVQRLFSMKGEPLAAARVAVLEEYDLALAAELVAGCDVWINLPRPPLEASGTSGMKSVLNGGLQLSVLDGWWCEAFDGTNGWAIDSDSGLDPGVQDARDADALYRLLENEVVPLFYRRDAEDLPRDWLRRIKASMGTIAPAFSMRRPLEEYVTRIYGAQR